MNNDRVIMRELRNVSARCLDMDSDADVVMHEVSYEYKESGVWVSKTTQVRATDPMDAIKYIKGGK